MDSDPKKRPTATNKYEKLINIISVEEENPTEIIKLSNIEPIEVNNSNKNRSVKSMRCSESQSGK